MEVVVKAWPGAIFMRCRLFSSFSNFLSHENLERRGSEFLRKYIQKSTYVYILLVYVTCIRTCVCRCLSLASFSAKRQIGTLRCIFAQALKGRINVPRTRKLDERLLKRRYKRPFLGGTLASLVCPQTIYPMARAFSGGFKKRQDKRKLIDDTYRFPLWRKG